MKRGENGGEKMENCNREGAKLKMEGGKSSKMRRRGPFFFFSFAFHFSKSLKFVLGLPKWRFSTGRKLFTPGKKSGKMTLPPWKNFPVTPLTGNREFLKPLLENVGIGNF